MKNEHLSKYVDIHNGGSALLFCSGQSFDKFKFVNEFKECLTIAINQVVIHPIFRYRNPDYHISIDPFGLLHYSTHPEIYDNVKVNYNIFRGFDPNRPWGLPHHNLNQWSDSIFNHVIPFEFYSILPHIKIEAENSHVVLIGEDIERVREKPFSSDISKEDIYGNMSVVFVALQILLSMGFKKIYLVGADIVGGYWFHKNNDSIEYRDILWSTYDFKERWCVFKEWVDSSEKYNNVEIISINPEGLVGLFEDKYI
jgi:hypothetical protein